MLIFEFTLAAPIFILLFFISAPYGKFTKKGWGPAISARAGWLLMELPAVILPLYFFIRRGVLFSPVFILYIIVWEVHYFQRTFIYPARINRGSHKMPLLIILFSAAFNLINGCINGFGVFILGEPATGNAVIFRIIAGVIIFVAGFIINIHSDSILRNLRAPGETGYKIPQKGLFKWICSPHYLGEILEWTGWAVMTWSPAGAAFLVFTIANLAPRAFSNLKWYRATFSDFPPARKALIPGVF